MEKKYPIGGYAPGDYWHKACKTCGNDFIGDKRAWNCEPCGEISAIEKSPQTDPYRPLFDHMDQEHGLTLLDSEMADIVHLVEKMQTSDKSQFIREYKQYKENLKYLGGQGEWTLDKVSRMNNIEVWETIKGFNELIAFLDTVLYAYEEGAHDWEERCLKAESATPEESDAVDIIEFAEWAAEIAWFDEEYRLWNFFEEGKMVDGRFRFTTSEFYELFKKTK